MNPVRPGGMREQTTRERWRKVHDLLGQGVGLLECARRLDVALNTVKRYARMNEPTGDRRAPRYRPTLVDAGPRTRVFPRGRGEHGTGQRSVEHPSMDAAPRPDQAEPWPVPVTDHIWSSQHA